MKDNTTTEGFRRYSGVAILLHWLIAALLVVNVGLALSIDSLPDGWVRPFVNTHKSIGITVLGLAILRVLWRIGHTPPPLPSYYSRWEKAGSHAAHMALYLLIFALPLSGWMHDSAWKDYALHPMRWFDLFYWPPVSFIRNLEPQTKETMHTLLGTVHESLAYVLYVLLALHIAGALKHQFLDKEPEFQRILPGRGRP
jgi:cytochrome b561